nr:DUF4169 family protein [Pseudaestuariivita rosea]
MNQYRKTKAHADKKARADQNAVKFGRTKAEKRKETQETQTLRDRLDQHKLDGE